jgi:dihydrofolate reductase
MHFALIAAMSKNKVIGRDSQLPWKFPSDMKFFKETTTGKAVVMGRLTFESINSKPLPNRLNIVISSQIKPDNIDESIVWLNDPTALNLTNFPALSDQEVFIIGGSSIYSYFLDKSKFLYLTLIGRDYEGDSYFPDYESIFNQTIFNKTIIEKEVSLTFLKLQNPKL